MKNSCRYAPAVKSRGQAARQEKKKFMSFANARRGALQKTRLALLCPVKSSGTITAPALVSWIFFNSLGRICKSDVVRTGCIKRGNAFDDLLGIADNPSVNPLNQSGQRYFHVVLLSRIGLGFVRRIFFIIGFNQFAGDIDGFRIIQDSALFDHQQVSFFLSDFLCKFKYLFFQFINIFDSRSLNSD